jgi:hypothetical protein
MVWNHPTIGKIYVLMKLHRDHFGIHLNDYTFQPGANPIVFVIIMVAKNLHDVADPVVAIFIGS